MRFFSSSFNLFACVSLSGLVGVGCVTPPHVQPATGAASTSATVEAKNANEPNAKVANADAPGASVDFSQDNSTDVFQPSWSDASGMDGKGGFSLFSSTDRRLLMRDVGFSASEGEKSLLATRPDWTLFHGAAGKSIALEWIWVTEGEKKYWDRMWAGAGLAFNSAWSTVDARSAKALVFWARANETVGTPDLKVALHSSSGAKGAENTGTVSLLDYIDGGRLDTRFRRVTIPISAFPNVAQVDLSVLQTINFDVAGSFPENQRTGVYLDGFQLTEDAVAVPIDGLGYLVDGDELVLLWNPRSEFAAQGLVVNYRQKPLTRVKSTDKSVRIKTSAFGTDRRPQLEIAALGGAAKSTPVRVDVGLDTPSVEDVRITVESQPQHVISKYIFGTNYASPSVIRGAGLTVNRWGGNATSRYNWQGDLSSSASDWFFLNHETKPVGTPEEKKDYYSKIANTLQAGADVNFTIPMLPWIAKPHPVPGKRYCSFPLSRFPKQQHSGSEGCGNGVLSNGEKIWENDPNVTSIPNSPEFERGLVKSITRHFGRAAQKGVRFYSLDNEPGLWFETHRDVMPKGVSTAELAALSETYATMIKDVDPDAQVIGFGAWGVMELSASNLDYTPPGRDGYKRYNDFKGAESERYRERKQNGDLPQLITLLKKFAEFEKKHGKRLVDIIDVHWYPELYATDAKGKKYRLSEDMPFDEVLFAKHLNSTREWFDASFVPDGKDITSWTAEPALKAKLWDPWHPVIPALKRIIDENYPGTKLAINEFTTGAEKRYHGAIVRAITYGIFIQEDLYMASNWGQVSEDTFTYYVQKLFSNYDDNGGRFSGHFLRSKSSSKKVLSFVANDGNRQMVMLVNTSLKVASRVTVPQPKFATEVKTWLMTESAGKRIITLPGRVGKQQITVVIPPLSVALLVQK